MSHTPMVTVREKVTGTIRKINLADLDASVEPVVPDVRPVVTEVTKRDRDRIISLAVRY